MTSSRRFLNAIGGPAALAALCAMAGCSLEPGFTSVTGEQSFPCYAEEPISNLDVAFDGHEAIVADRGGHITLNFVSSIWPRMEDRYENGGYVLTIDPEAALERPDGSRRGPCH